MRTGDEREKNQVSQACLYKVCTGDGIGTGVALKGPRWFWLDSLGGKLARERGVV